MFFRFRGGPITNYYTSLVHFQHLNQNAGPENISYGHCNNYLKVTIIDG